MPSYKLYYFDGRGRAEVARLIFAAAGKVFEDIRMSREEWQAFKPKTPFGQMPVLEVDGKLYGQSVAIYNFLAKEFGFYGKTATDQIQVDQIVMLVEDLISVAVKGFVEKDESKKAELDKNFAEVEVPKYMGLIIKHVKSNGTGYMVGSSMTLADIVVFNFCNGMEIRNPKALEHFPEIKALCEKVLSNEKIKTFIANRKQTPF